MKLSKNDYLLFALIAFLASILFSGLLFSSSLDAGLSKFSSRFGADVIVFPQGSAIPKNGILLQGDLKTANLPQELLHFIRTQNGIQKATPQLFFSSLGASCCEKKVNIIGFDPKSDFVIQPWIAKKFGKEIPSNALIVGSDIQINAEKSIRFFHAEFEIDARLDPLGNRVDQAVFATIETVEKIKAAAKKKGFQFDETETGISAILIKTNENFDGKKFSQNVHSHFDGIQIASKKEMFSEIVKTVNLFQVISYALIILFLAIAFGCILIVFSLFIQERKEELKVIYLVGGSKSLIKKLVAIRVFKGSLAGSFLGILFGVLLTFPFRIALSDYFGFSLTLSHSFSFFLILLTAFFIPIFAAEFAVWIHFRRLVKQFNWG